MTVHSLALAVALFTATAQAAPPPVDLWWSWAGHASGDGKVARRLRTGADAATWSGALVPTALPTAPDGRVQVYVDCDRTGKTELDALADAGLRVDTVRDDRVQGWVAPDDVDALAAFGWVRTVRPADRAVTRAGAVTTAGDAGARADVVRAGGLDGTGVVVGVISDGIDSVRDAQDAGELPAVEVPFGCPGGSGDEGTALLEIVHDVAPGARLLFAGPTSSVDMVEAVECLVVAGVDVIVDDLGFFGEPYFADGPVAAAVATAVAAGVSYHSSAGNEAQEHYEDDFRDPTLANVHEFAPGDTSNTIVVPPEGTLTCILQWDDPFRASGNDYDMAVLDADANVIDFSTNFQNGRGDPIEVVEVTNTTDEPQLADVLVVKFRGDDKRLELFCLGGAVQEHTTTAGSIVGHPALAEVVAVGAIDAADPGLDEVEAFSSQGPATIAFPVPAERAKPDVAALDGVAISNAGGFPACPPFCAFFGTSAAAPHAAGVAALLLEHDPTLSPAAIQAALQAGAVDIGAIGFDDLSGFGRLDAVAALAALVPSEPPYEPPPDEQPPPDDGDCTDDTDCDDDDPCTEDRCDAAACVSAPLAGVDGAQCAIEQLADPDVCDPDPLDDRTAAALEQRTTKVLLLLDRATPTAFRKAVRVLGRLRARIGRAQAKDAITPDCSDRLTALVQSAQDAFRTAARAR